MYDSWFRATQWQADVCYNSLTKQPLQTIEVDGWQFHKNRDVQQQRDTLKDQLLTKFGLRPHRILTTDTVNVETIETLLQESLWS